MKTIFQYERPWQKFNSLVPYILEKKTFSPNLNQTQFQTQYIKKNVSWKNSLLHNNLRKRLGDAKAWQKLHFAIKSDVVVVACVACTYFIYSIVHVSEPWLFGMRVTNDAYLFHERRAEKSDCWNVLGSQIGERLQRFIFVYVDRELWLFDTSRDFFNDVFRSLPYIGQVKIYYISTP